MKPSDTDICVENSKNDEHAGAYQHLFLLSHMRANTSLMSHILGSHAQICGYYEMHRSYLTENDLFKQEQLLLSRETGKEMISRRCHYLFDKILHNDYKLLLNHLLSRDIKILVSIRPPEQTIKSIINLFGQKNSSHPYAEPEAASTYYLQRLAELVGFCQRYKDHYYYYDAELLRTNPQKVLKHVQCWLSLTSPLTEQYQVFAFTGQPRMGDSSENIKTGRIIKPQVAYEHIAIPAHLLHRAVAQSGEYRQRIIDHSIDSITG